MDLRDYYDNHWTHVPEGQVDYSRLQYVRGRARAGRARARLGLRPGVSGRAPRRARRRTSSARTCRSVGPERTRGRGIEARQVDLDTEPLPFADGEFDAVVANSNLEHLFFMHRHIRECVRCVKPGGKFIWLVPNIGHWRYRLWLLFGRFPYVPNSPTDEYHIRYVTAYEGRKLLREAGLTKIRLRGHAGTWVRGLYPRLLVNKYTKRYFDPPYEVLVRHAPVACSRVTSASTR